MDIIKIVLIFMAKIAGIAFIFWLLAVLAIFVAIHMGY